MLGAWAMRLTALAVGRTRVAAVVRPVSRCKYHSVGSLGGLLGPPVVDEGSPASSPQGGLMPTASPPPAHGTADPREPEPALQVPLGTENHGVSAHRAPARARGDPSDPTTPGAICDLGTALPRPGARLTLLRSYPDGVMAILDKRNGRVMFCRLQEMFESNLDWQPVKYPGRSETL